MKKRACRVATDYDEFRNMVACAHLKKLSKKEVESLSHVKKGWINTNNSVSNSNGKGNSSLLVLSKEKEKEELLNSQKNNPIAVKDVSDVKKPKTAMELEKSLKRIATDEEKFR